MLCCKYAEWAPEGYNPDEQQNKVCLLGTVLGAQEQQQEQQEQSSPL